MSDFTFKCPYCQQSIEAPEEMRGTVSECPSCNVKIKIPVQQAFPRAKLQSASLPQPQKKNVFIKKPASPNLASSKTRACPFCGEEILSIAIKCKHCSSDLWKSDRAFSSTSTGGILAKLREGVLITVACLSIMSFFMPNAVISIPILGKMNISMYDAVSSFCKSPKSKVQNADRIEKPDVKTMVQSGKITEAGVGGIVTAVAVAGLAIHYVLSIFWCIGRIIMGKSVEIINKLWLFTAIQFPVLLTIGSSFVLASMKSEMAKKNDGSFGATLGTAFLNSFSIEPGLIMWALFMLSLCGLITVILSRKMVAST